MPTGIMRASWNSKDMEAVGQRYRKFNREQRERIHRKLQARLSQAWRTSSVALRIDSGRRRGRTAASSWPEMSASDSAARDKLADPTTATRFGQR
jgi:hypothetical protein